MEEINNPVSNSIPRNKIERELMLANIDLDRSPDISFEKYVEYNKLLVNALSSFAIGTFIDTYSKTGSFKLARKEPKPKDKTTNNQKRY